MYVDKIYSNFEENPYIENRKQEQNQVKPENIKLDIIKRINKIRNYFTSNWFYINQAGSITRRTLKIVALKCSGLEPRLKNIISSLALLSGYSFYKSLGWDIPEAFQKFWNQCELFHVTRDIEGAFFDTLSLITNPADALDSLGIFSNNLASLGLIRTINCFSIIGLPLAIGLLAYASAKGMYLILNRNLFLYRLSHASNEDLQKIFHEMDLTQQEKEKLQIIKNNIHTNSYHWDLTKEEENKLVETLQTTLETSNEAEREKIKKEIKAIKQIAFVKGRKRDKLVRKTDEKVVEIMKKHQESLKRREQRCIDQSLRDIRALTKRRIAVDCVNTIGQAALCATLIAEATLSGIFIQSVFLIRSGAFVGRKIYEDYWMYKNVTSLNA